MQESQAEADTQKAAAGPGVLPILNTTVLDDALFHFMPLAGYGNGREVQRLLHSSNDITLNNEILGYVVGDVLTGLQTIHKNGFAHLDVKPENVVFKLSGEGFVTDFGCTKEIDASKRVVWKANGDSGWFPPERCEGHRAQSGSFDGEKADSWAAGILFLEMYSGKDSTELLNLHGGFRTRIANCNTDFFRTQLQKITELQNPMPGSLMSVVKGLLEV